MLNVALVFSLDQNTCTKYLPVLMSQKQVLLASWDTKTRIAFILITHKYDENLKSRMCCFKPLTYVSKHGENPEHNTRRSVIEYTVYI